MYSHEKYLDHKYKYRLTKGEMPIYQLIDIDNRNDMIEIDGKTLLTFNDTTSNTMHDTYTAVLSKNGNASKCFSVSSTNSWYQLINHTPIVYQISHDGSKKRIVRVAKLSDEEIKELLDVPVHSGPGTDDTIITYTDKNDMVKTFDSMTWTKHLYNALQTGRTTIDDINRIIRTSNWLGGRWFVSHMRTFKKTYPEYNQIIV